MGLEVGDPCPWCGGLLDRPTGALRPDEMAGEMTADSLTNTQAGQSALVCGECGCEIDSPEDPARSAHTQFDRAA